GWRPAPPRCNCRWWTGPPRSESPSPPSGRSGRCFPAFRLVSTSCSRSGAAGATESMKPVSVAEARAAVMAAARVQPAVRMPLGSSVGHRLSEDVTAPWPLPRWTAASMDGWAVHSADIDRAGAVLEVAGGSDAGDAEPPTLQRGMAWRVATGGRVPAGADTVIRQEDEI